ncbi:MAG: helicase, partial [Atopostipes sp.]|nr:helicase [Atopostipes sp.]
LHANEYVLLSYYIATINIEAIFDEVSGSARGYTPFEGIVLTDTFESMERQDSFIDELFGENNRRLKQQQEKSITAIISNPPYSVGQGNANDDNQNVHYEKLEDSVQKTYVNESKAGLSKGAYDSYIKAFRWATDRLGDKGVIGFVTNGSFIDSNSTDGLRASLYKEFNHLYIFNLRGNQRTQGEQSRKEGGKIFGSGSRAPIAISILVKDDTDYHEIHYYDIGDYLSQKQKFDLIDSSGSIENIDWNNVTPDENNDWINQRDPNYQNYVRISGEEGSPFLNNAVGVSTNRDIWVSGFSKNKVQNNTEYMVGNYNSLLAKEGGKNKKPTMKDSRKIKWTTNLENMFKRGEEIELEQSNLRLELYRPYTKKWIMYDKDIVERPGQFYRKWGDKNQAIVTTGRGASRNFSALITDQIPSLDLMEKGQSFMRLDNQNDKDLFMQFDENINQIYANKLNLSLDETFAYVYAILNSNEYQQKYANDLKKDLARIPFVANKEKYVEIGQKLIDLHINYEYAPMYQDVTVESDKDASYVVKKMRFAKKRNERGKSVNDKTTIIFNSDITIHDIPEEAYRYVVNGRSAIEWIMNQYQVKTDKKSGITDDPNDFSDDPKYIYNLLLRIITVSLDTIELVKQLPKLELI